MLTADYCGDGTSFTVNNTPIRFAARGWRGFDHYVPLTSELEGIWTESGAACLSNTRRPMASLDPATQQHCKLPAPCDGPSDPNAVRLVPPAPVPPDGDSCDDTSGSYIVSTVVKTP